MTSCPDSPSSSASGVMRSLDLRRHVQACGACAQREDARRIEHARHRRHGLVVGVEDATLVGRARIADLDLEQESIDLRFRKRRRRLYQLP